MLGFIVVLPAILVQSCVGRTRDVPYRSGVPVEIALYVHSTGQVVKMDLEEYLVGVLAAEMPASFSAQALKAQAIAARTYAIKRLRCFGKSGSECHPKADICDDPTHAQAWISQEEAYKKWGALNAKRLWTRLVDAVRDTEAMVILYDGLLIESAFHSTCGGMTEDSEAVWQKSLPYLRAVECAWCAQSPKNESTVRVSIPEAGRILELHSGQNPLATQDSISAKVLERTTSGRAKTVEFNGLVLDAAETRRLFGLASTKFDLSRSDQGLEFTVSGYGHGVGMCQYGAAGMAKAGYTAEQIIQHYFPGTEVSSMWQVR